MIKIINALTISPLEIILINFHLTNQEIINQLNQIDPSLLITNNQHDIHTAEDFLILFIIFQILSMSQKILQVKYRIIIVHKKMIF